MNKLIFALLAVIILVGGFFVLNSYMYQEKQGPTDYKDATYLIEGEPVTLVDGVAETESAPGRASKTITRYFGNEVKGGLNSDTKNDLAFILSQETGGSGNISY